MAKHTLYAYLEGAADDSGMGAEFARLINSTQWRGAVPWLVDQQHPLDSSLTPGDVPDRDLGINIDLPDPSAEPEGWFSDIELIVQFLTDLYSATGNEFVIGISDNERRYSEDLFWIDSESPDLGQLRQVIGVRD